LPFALTVSSCGYQLTAFGKLPENIQSVSFNEVENETLQVGVEKELQMAMEREFHRRGVTIADEGEGIVSVVLRSFMIRPISVSGKDQELEYQVSLRMDIVLTRRDTGKVLWKSNNLSVSSESSAIPQVGVTTSPDFQRGTLEAKDLRGFTNIQYSESQRRLAVENLFTSAARRVYDNLTDSINF
jgi:outer membrane lipopolysaccharide assembly protein LptE/RlpB